MLLAIFVTMSDARIGAIAPRVNDIVTTYGSGYSLIGTIKDYKILIQVTKTYFIDSPSMWVINTISIPNPSNFSYSGPSSACYSDNSEDYSSPPTSCGVIAASVASPRAGLTTEINASNSIQSFDLTLNPINPQYSVPLTMNYSDYVQVTPSPLVAFSGTPSQIGGAVYYRQIYVTLSNPLKETLSTYQLEIGQYTEFLKASCAINGTVETYGCTNNSTIPNVVTLRDQYLKSGQTIRFAINVTYSGTAYW